MITVRRMDSKTEKDELWEDPIVAEVRAAREEIFARAGYDLKELGRQLAERSRQQGNRTITLKPRRVKEPPRRG